MSQSTAPLPGFWRFIWLFWMQPVTLHRLLRSLGIDQLESGWELFRRQRTRNENWWHVRLVQMLVLVPPMLVLTVTSISVAYGWNIDWLRLAIGMAIGTAVGMAALSGGPALGVGAATAGCLMGAGLGGLLGGGSTGHRTFALALIVTGAMFVGLDDDEPPLSLVWASYITIGRLPILLVETISQTAAWYWNLTTGRKCLRWVPVLYHEMSYLPHPFLESHILSEAEGDPVLTRRVLGACSIAPGQRRTARKVEAKLRARDLKRLADANDFQAIAELRGLWLPGVQGANELLLAFSEAGRYLAAAQAAFNPHHQLKHLDGFASELNAIENQLRANRNAFTQPFEEPLVALRRAGEVMRAEAEKKAVGLIPNPFRAGNPLSDEEGPELFRGRETAVRDIEEILSDASRAASLQLLAPRRAGKPRF
jgi:hypothetical protein